MSSNGIIVESTFYNMDHVVFAHLWEPDDQGNPSVVVWFVGGHNFTFEGEAAKEIRSWFTNNGRDLTRGRKARLEREAAQE